MSKTITTIILVIIIIIGAFFIFGKKELEAPESYQSEDVGGTEEDTSNNSSTSGSANTGGTSGSTGQTDGSGNTDGVIMQKTVVYDGSRFIPATLEISLGETVRFVNQGSNLMWVASNPHPMHTGLSSFDERNGVPNGGSYEYTFAEEGTFGYHNHLNPSAKGQVTVILEK